MKEKYTNIELIEPFLENKISTPIKILCVNDYPLLFVPSGGDSFNFNGLFLTMFEDNVDALSISDRDLLISESEEFTLNYRELNKDYNFDDKGRITKKLHIQTKVSLDYLDKKNIEGITIDIWDPEFDQNVGDFIEANGYAF